MKIHLCPGPKEFIPPMFHLSSNLVHGVDFNDDNNNDNNNNINNNNNDYNNNDNDIVSSRYVCIRHVFLVSAAVVIIYFSGEWSFRPPNKQMNK